MNSLYDGHRYYVSYNIAMGPIVFKIIISNSSYEYMSIIKLKGLRYLIDNLIVTCIHSCKYFY